MFKLYQPAGKALPKELTSYDFIKAYAVLLMIVDHVGYYFYPDEDWLRVIGRLCVPVWFFLIGYARSRDMSERLWIGAAILVVADIIVGIEVFPLNILATMLFIRLVIDRVMASAVKNYEVLFGIGFMLFFLSIPTSFLLDYGVSGVLFAMFGWFMRNRDQVKYSMRGIVESFVLVFCVGAWSFYQIFAFQFDQLHASALVAGIAAVCGVLFFFRPVVYPGLTHVMPAPVVWSLQILGRRTLEIYVAHLVLFKFWAILFNENDDRFNWFDFKLSSLF
ncbi:MAG: hypothetical protein EOM26_06315 [Alphaproteobacteria bacterium]|nr:hypothetical protein [Alphaproteobacteria bacterium]